MAFAPVHDRPLVLLVGGAVPAAVALLLALRLRRAVSRTTSRPWGAQIQAASSWCRSGESSNAAGWAAGSSAG
jgi:hypothetical protein